MATIVRWRWQQRSRREGEEEVLACKEQHDMLANVKQAAMGHAEEAAAATAIDALGGGIHQANFGALI